MTATQHEPDAAVVEPTGSVSLRSRFGPGLPGVPLGPFARWPRTSDAVLAVFVFATTLVTVAASELDEGKRFTSGAVGDRPLAAFVLLAVASGALWWRRAHPIEVTTVVLVAMTLWAVAQLGDGNDLPLMVAIYSVGRYATDHLIGFAMLGAAVAASLVDSVVDTSQRIDVLPALLLPALPWYVGRRVRNRVEYLALLRERAERLEAEQASEARRAVVDERARIARELHDVVAHQVSMMTVQAGAAKTIARDDPDAAIEAMADVERAGRDALGELRHLLGVMRPETGDDDLGPQRGLPDVPDLVEQLRHTGATVEIAMDELPERLTAAIELSAFRIIQEAFTNIVKHAGPNPSVDVAITADGGAVVIEVVNTVTAAVANGRIAMSLPASGYGIAGMRERAALLGGTLVAGPLADDRYRVRAGLPFDGETP